MTQILGSFQRDANGVPITYKGLTVSKLRAYDGTAGNGAQGATTLFTVTGNVMAAIFASCSEDLAGATATIEVGIAGNTAALIAQSTATNIDNGHIWLDTSPATVENYPTEKLIKASANIIETIATADITDGTLRFYCLWVPISTDGNVVAA